MKTPNISTRSPKTAGFTLVELMVVVLIISVLAAIAYPGYRSHVVKTQRGAAKACLAQFAAFMERRYTTELTYAGTKPALGCESEGNMEQNYTFTLPAATATAYTVRASPTTAFAARDTLCGSLTLDQAGVRGVSTGNADECW